MIGYIIKKVIGSKNDREVKRLRPVVTRINEIEASLQSLSAQRPGTKEVILDFTCEVPLLVEDAQLCRD